MANQTKLWSNPKVVAERRLSAEAFMGREMELPGRRYSPAEKRVAAAHLGSVAWAKPGQASKQRTVSGEERA